jgi:hypothetical protein
MYFKIVIQIWKARKNIKISNVKTHNEEYFTYGTGFSSDFFSKNIFWSVKNNKIFNFEDISKTKPTTRFC